ncbi:MAG: toprim domain-containing protein [bacterium]
MAIRKDHGYDEQKIKTLSSVEHIRLRTGMYIGRLGDGSHYDDGIYILLKEVIDNAIDEFIMGFGKEVAVSVQGTSVTVRDFGRGIPLGKVLDCVSRINTGAKYNDDVFQFSVGLNGVGTKAVNALSSDFTVRSHREERFAEARFRQGKLVGQHSGKSPGEPDGTLVAFTPDPDIFGQVRFLEEHVSKRFRHYAYLNAGLRLVYNGEVVSSRNGLLDLIDEEAADEAIYPPLHATSKMLEIAFTHSNSRYGETYYSFVNGQLTSSGGTHLSAFREGLLKAVNEFSKKRFEGDDVREGIIGAIAIKLKEPVFESQTKNKLGNTDIRTDLVQQVRDVATDLLHRNLETAQKILAKIEDTQRLHKELQSVKKMARERARSISIRIPQLKDCKVHLNKKKLQGTESMIFITEGQSAAGSIVSCRDVSTQAIFTLKGKPLNVWDLKRDALYKNEETYNLMRGLNIEDTVDGLRYHKVILATDADVDGLHIRNLLITFFLRFFDSLVSQGHLHILETPLFRVRNKAKTFYCYSEAERQSALKEIGRGAEITRFKGLGEISPSEFKRFIGPDMRLTPVVCDGRHSIRDILCFYMGKNTQERRNYIMERLVVEEQE